MALSPGAVGQEDEGQPRLLGTLEASLGYGVEEEVLQAFGSERR